MRIEAENRSHILKPTRRRQDAAHRSASAACHARPCPAQGGLACAMAAMGLGSLGFLWLALAELAPTLQGADPLHAMHLLHRSLLSYERPVALSVLQRSGASAIVSSQSESPISFRYANSWYVELLVESSPTGSYLLTWIPFNTSAPLDVARESASGATEFRGQGMWEKGANGKERQQQDAKHLGCRFNAETTSECFLPTHRVPCHAMPLLGGRLYFHRLCPEMGFY